MISGMVSVCSSTMKEKRTCRNGMFIGELIRKPAKHNGYGSQVGINAMATCAKTLGIETSRHLRDFTSHRDLLVSWADDSNKIKQLSMHIRGEMLRMTIGTTDRRNDTYLLNLLSYQRRSALPSAKICCQATTRWTSHASLERWPNALKSTIQAIDPNI